MYFIDVELTKDWFYVGVLTPNGKHLIFHKPNAKIRKILKNETTVGFNSRNFDMPLIQAWLKGKKNFLHTLANDLVNNHAKWWDYWDEDDYDHIDLKEPAPGVHVSLKLYMARMHAKRIDDMFHDQSDIIDPKSTYAYNLNDLIGTKMLYEAIKHEIDLREHMGKEFDLDLRSRSGAQIAERVLVKMAGYNGKTPDRPSYVRYKVPKGRVKFKSPELKALKKRIESHKFVISEHGKVVLPEWLGKDKIHINGRQYQVGIGGLHSVNRNETFNDVVDIDVASYYPSMLIENDFYPSHIGRAFFNTYRKIYEERLEAKRKGDKFKSNSLKLLLNSTFGKLGERYSKMYSPDMLLAITLTGQLQLLNLIEMFERKNIHVVSANTDGVSVQGDIKKIRKVYKKWEKRTAMVMEETHYKLLAMRDVNNYLAVLADGSGVKAKGVYAEPDLSKNPEHPIVFEAIRAYLQNGTPIEKTIDQCTDIRRFISARTVNGGAVFLHGAKDDSLTATQFKNRYGITLTQYKRDQKALDKSSGKFLGRVIRWIYVKGGDGKMYYLKSGNSVPRTFGSIPVQKLPKNNKVPKNIDRDRYILIARDYLYDLGIRP